MMPLNQPIERSAKFASPATDLFILANIILRPLCDEMNTGKSRNNTTIRRTVSPKTSEITLLVDLFRVFVIVIFSSPTQGLRQRLLSQFLAKSVSVPELYPAELP
jgi:hypothetical protein